MARTLRSRLLSSAFAGLLTLAAGGCAVLSDLGLGPDEAATGRDALPPNPDIATMLRVAEATQARGDLATAAALYQRASERAPEDPTPLVRLGFTLTEAGATAQAAEAFRGALRVDPSNADALRGLGMALLQRNQIDLALQQFQAALDLREDVRLYNAMGVAYDMLGDHHGAQLFYQIGLDVAPTNLSLRSNYGLSLALAGYYGEAIGVLDSLAADPMAAPEHRQVLAMAYGLAGDYAAAARTGRIDLNEATVAQNLSYYQALRNLRLNTAGAGAGS